MGTPCPEVNLRFMFSSAASLSQFHNSGSWGSSVAKTERDTVQTCQNPELEINLQREAKEDGFCDCGAI